MDKIVSLCKRRGFIFQGSDMYGGLAGTWDFGPLGVALKNNIKRLWWERFVIRRMDMFGVESAILMNPKVWEASGHVATFTDPLIDCKKCKGRFRADAIDSTKECPNCGAHDFTHARPFNMMFKTHAGPVEDSGSCVYLRPETAQGMFTNFKNVIDAFHPKLPFGLVQIGKAFRNEITPGNFIFRSREFEQMEIEYFVRESEWEKHFDIWRGEMRDWMTAVGITAFYEREVSGDALAHYSKRTVDIDYEFPFGREELYGIAYRTDFDLKNHAEYSKIDLSYVEDDGSKYTPHVIEPTFGVERTVLALLVSAYEEEKLEKETRTVLKFKPCIAPVTVAVFPLVANKEGIVGKAKEIYDSMRIHFVVQFDDIGNVGKRYRRQDEIGTPWCVTVDYQTLEDGTVTIRDLDTMKQERVIATELIANIKERLKG
ncbi:MAG: glycine--tRNA ligase [Patescibacteria group bacterium]